VAIVTVDQLNDFMSSPLWTSAQRAACADILTEVEADLEAVLCAPVSPEPREEVAGVLPSGLVATTAPVVVVTSVDGTAAPDAATLSDLGYTLGADGWLRRREPASLFGPVTVGLTTPPVAAIAAVSLAYQAGWGDRPWCRGAILRRAAAMMANRHADTVTATGLDAQPPPPASEGWDQTAKTAIQRYRIRGVRR
jgi:hypothetical protein